MTIQLSESLRETAYEKHLEAFGDQIARVLSYLSQRHGLADFMRDMHWLLSRIKYSSTSTSFAHGKLHPTKTDFVNNVISLKGRTYFSILSAYHPTVPGAGANKYENLLTGSAAFQESLIRCLTNKLSAAAVANTNSVYAHCRLLLEEIFNYKAFLKGGRITVNADGSAFAWHSDSSAAWSAGQYIKNLGVRYCPYCNAETIYAFTLKNKRAIPYASALDHFLPKSVYPFLALNLNNLVPSCTRCNTSLKNRCETNLNDYATPYREDIYRGFVVRLNASKDAVFSVCKGRMKDLNVMYRESDVAFAPKVKKLMEDVFHWSDVYNQIFCQELQDIVRRVRILTPSYRRWISGRGGSKFAKRSIERVLFGTTMSRADIAQFRFSKVTQDLAERYAGVVLRD